MLIPTETSPLHTVTLEFKFLLHEARLYICYTVFYLEFWFPFVFRLFLLFVIEQLHFSTFSACNNYSYLYSVYYGIISQSFFNIIPSNVS